MFCSRCGNPVADDACFCMHCGSKVEAAATRAEPDAGHGHVTNYDPGRWPPQQAAQTAVKMGSQMSAPMPGQTAARPSSQWAAHVGAQVTAPRPDLAGAPAFESFPLHPVSVGVIPNMFNDIRTDAGKRSEIYIPCHMPEHAAYQTAMDVLSSEGYSPRRYKEEVVWKKGTGLVSSMHYIKLIPLQGHLYVQGWVMMGLGDAVLLEQPLSGVVGIIPKNSTKKTIERLQHSV